MVCLDSAALNSVNGPDFAPQLCYTRHSREAGSCTGQLTPINPVRSDQARFLNRPFTTTPPAFN